ncbi:MAG: hypothetical protein KJ645_10895 [Planctomycetes bacterium]|nr:hypothetical protein [Planctomycetota bacterium]
MDRQLDHLGEPIAKGAKLLILNLPAGDTVQAQFTESQLRVQLDDPDLSVRILTDMPMDDAMGAGMEIERDSSNGLILRGAKMPGSSVRSPLLMRSDKDPFAWISFESGTRIVRERLEFELEVLKGEQDRCTALKFVFPEPLEHYTIIRFHADTDMRMPHWIRQRRGWAEIVPTPQMYIDKFE